MIITSLPRSGSTKFAFDKAAELNLPFYDEPFEYDIDATHKFSIHEMTLASPTPKSVSFLQSLDFTKCVINNHEITYFTLEQTDIFMSRQNVQDSLWSYVAYADRYIQRQINRSSDDMLNLLLSKYFKRALFFFDYAREKNKEIIIPDLSFSSSENYRYKYARFHERITKFGDELVLPAGFIYK